MHYFLFLWLSWVFPSVHFNFTCIITLKDIIYRKLVEFVSDPSLLKKSWWWAHSHSSSILWSWEMEPRGEMWQRMLTFVVHTLISPVHVGNMKWYDHLDYWECWFEMILYCVNVEHAINWLLSIFLFNYKGGESMFWKAMHPRTVFSNFKVAENHLECL